MGRNIQEAMIHRRSYYSLSNKSPITNQEIADILKSAIKHVPSAFNSQSTRIILLLNNNHTKFWEITKNTLKKLVSEEAFKNTESKIDNSFSSGYGTVLFYEDQDVIENLQKNFSTYADKFPEWSQHSSAMHQWVIWTMLEDSGFGASLQHYNPIIDDEVAKTWAIKPSWKLIAQMPFGTPLSEPEAKEFAPLEDRVIIYE